MNEQEYRVIFFNGEFEDVHAFSTSEAMILAQAEQIKKGNSYEVKSVLEFEDRGCPQCLDLA